MATQVITAGAASTASTAIQGDKVKVVNGSSIAVFYAVGTNPTANLTTCEIIPPNSVRSINMQGLGKKIAFITAVGAASLSVTPCAVIANSTISA